MELLVSKKGIVITGVILAAITVGSFSIWLIPGDTGDATDAMELTQLLTQIHEERVAIQDTIQLRYQELLEGGIDTETFVLEAQAATDQMTEIVSMLASAETYGTWDVVYNQYIEITQTSNAMVQEMMVVANAVESGIEYQASIDRIGELNAALENMIGDCESENRISILSEDICL